MCFFEICSYNIESNAASSANPSILLDQTAGSSASVARENLRREAEKADDRTLPDRLTEKVNRWMNGWMDG